ncbi:sterol carrier family protein [uncultured Arthrobacter sp.]|uniref:sterol carrier family protein n=1 Tax=uncultured Arthrobacter sp. TaxID=114050 RepID=UPI00263474C2|nr:sterol carrier family protein [uncultured Arthrobacter sp.]
MARRRIPAAAGTAAVRAVAAGSSDRTERTTAVRYSLEELAARAPGNTVEVRVPPLGVTQCVEGPRHTRGTPPNVIETDADTWLALITGALRWTEAVASGAVSASGQRADLSALLPLFPQLPPPPGPDSA